MDVVLIGKKDGITHILFIESKFLEYNNNTKNNLSKSYKHRNRWYDIDVNWNQIIDSIPQTKGYQEGIKQTITHLFGIHSLLSGEPCKALKDLNISECKVKFINLIFSPSDNFIESKAYEKYKNLSREFINSIRDVTGLKVIPEWVSYTELWKEIKDQYPQHLREYLQNKYMKFAKE